MTNSRVFSLLAALASPVFMVAAIAGWLTGRVPANPVTLGVAGFLVVAGPVLGLLHLAMVRRDDEEDEVTDEEITELLLATRVIPRTPPRLEVPVAPELAAARAFHNWRDNPLPAIAERERSEERARRPYARI